MERFRGRGEVVAEVQLVAGLESMGLWMMCVVRICDMRHDGACPDIVIEEGGWLVKATHSPQYLAGNCENSTKEKDE